MSLGENSLVAAYQRKGHLKSRPSGTRVVTIIFSYNVLLQYNGSCRPIDKTPISKPTMNNFKNFWEGPRAIASCRGEGMWGEGDGAPAKKLVPKH